ncbi:unnamed protein product [Ambrosiozyma monospora]|uniref:Unnamed protein product n=1 Tax=Ambrosiozyma monospora TaxID=43982 RepID=A0ACB5TQA6_AMBMO|nr:unnamed protein product [Ambrosiozyma monospora]
MDGNKDDTKKPSDEAPSIDSPGTMVIDTLKKGLGVDDSNERWQHDIEGDYSRNPHTSANAGNRPVDHLILCVHGIGQSLSSEFAGVNFAHDCNSFRKIMKSMFVEHPETYASLVHPNAKNGDDIENCKVQVLPIVWRYNIDFSLDYENPELDSDGTLRLPTLSQLNIEGVTPLRRLAADVVLDVLLYYEPEFKKKILANVVKSANALYDKYVERHPDFKGKVSLLGHSLGSSIALDILSLQPDVIPTDSNFDPKRHLKFEVENFFGCGSPNGVFKFMKRQNVRPRSMYPIPKDLSDQEILDLPVQSPKVKNYYNIFYPTDLVAYRVEPLVHRSLAKVRPEVIPYSNEKGINSKLLELSQAPYELVQNEVFKSFLNFTGLKTNFDDYINTSLENDSKNKKPSKRQRPTKLDPKASELLSGMNSMGRVDYSLPEGYFDIDMINAIGSHTQYLEDPDVVGFVLRQLFYKS